MFPRAAALQELRLRDCFGHSRCDNQVTAADGFDRSPLLSQRIDFSLRKKCTKSGAESEERESGWWERPLCRLWQRERERDEVQGVCRGDGDGEEGNVTREMAGREEEKLSLLGEKVSKLAGAPPEANDCAVMRLNEGLRQSSGLEESGGRGCGTS